MTTALGDAERALDLADEAFARMDVDGLVAHLSAAVRHFTAAGEQARAAMTCARLGDVLATVMGNLTAARAWFARARRLADELPPCVEQGWVAVAAMGCDVDDPAELLAAAELALDRARCFGDVNLETKALADAGLAHVQAGRVPEGMALLDEAMALACGPADDTDTAAKSVCSFFTACYHTADFERAGSWAELLRRHQLIGPAPGGPVFLSSHCDSVQAAMLVELGRWSEAEALLVAAKRDFEAAMGVPSWHPDIALAELRIRQGRLADAEALLLGKEQSLQALVPAARLHCARGDLDLARATVRRGLRALREDRLRAVELLAILVDVELAAGDLDAAVDACTRLSDRIADVDVPALRARSAAAGARVDAATGDLDGAIARLEHAVDALDARRLPWLRATLLLELAGLRDAMGDAAGAALDVDAAAAVLADLDVVVAPEQDQLLARRRTAPRAAISGDAAALRRDAKGWFAAHDGVTVRLAGTKGVRYLAELIARPGVEQHALDLVDRVEGVAPPGGIDRRALGDAGPGLDSRARTEYRHRIEELRTAADDALAAGRLEDAEAAQAELDTLVAQLAAAFGLGGRERRAASAAERARLNVTRALRAATARITDVLPEAGRALDASLRTGLYCVYEPSGGGIRWSVRA